MWSLDEIHGRFSRDSEFLPQSLTSAIAALGMLRPTSAGSKEFYSYSEPSSHLLRAGNTAIGGVIPVERRRF